MNVLNSLLKEMKILKIVLVKLSFEGDENIKDCFSIIPVEDKKLNVIIRESFLFGIFNISIIENSPLQLYYVTKDHWIKS